MTAAELRRKYIEFFKSKGHQEIKSASLIPDNDPTCLFTTAGMHPLVPYLQGAKHPSGTRLTDCQKCIRTWTNCKIFQKIPVYPLHFL